MKRRELLALLPDELKKRAPRKRKDNGPVNFEYQGFKVQIVGYFGNYLAFIDRPNDAPFWVKNWDGQAFTRRKKIRATCKTVIKWHHKFGGWVLPKRRQVIPISNGRVIRPRAERRGVGNQFNGYPSSGQRAARATPRKTSI